MTDHKHLLFSVVSVPTRSNRDLDICERPYCIGLCMLSLGWRELTHGSWIWRKLIGSRQQSCSQFSAEVSSALEALNKQANQRCAALFGHLPEQISS